jgi:hypothetical protein
MDHSEGMNHAVKTSTKNAQQLTTKDASESYRSASFCGLSTPRQMESGDPVRVKSRACAVGRTFTAASPSVEEDVEVFASSQFAGDASNPSVAI